MPTLDFERLDWEDYPSTQTPLSADNLNRLEDAMEGIYDDVDAQETTIANVLANFANPEPAAVATKDYLPGELLVLGEYLYKTTATVLTDDALVEGTNIEKTTVADAISKDVLMSFASVEYTSTASKSYAVGSYIIYNNVLYVVTYLIVAGQTITEGENVEKASFSDMFSGINTSIQNILGDFAAVESSATASKAYAVGDYLVLNGTFYKVTASIAQGDTIVTGTNVSATTIDAELKLTAGSAASGVSYDNTESGLTADNVQDALDEVNLNSTHQLLEANYKVTSIASGVSHVTNITLDAPTGYKFLCVLRAITNGWIGTVSMPIISQTSTSEVIDLWLSPATPNANCSVDVKYLVYK